MSDSTPSLFELWQQAGADRDRYRDLMREHGMLLSPGDDGYEQASRKLPCGWEPGKTRAQQDRCEITDLLRDSCAHCTGRTGEEAGPDLDPAKFGNWFAARYPGRCSLCDRRIEEEDQIRADGDGGYLCGSCGGRTST